MDRAMQYTRGWLPSNMSWMISAFCGAIKVIWWIWTIFGRWIINLHLLQATRCWFGKEIWKQFDRRFWIIWKKCSHAVFRTQKKARADKIKNKEENQLHDVDKTNMKLWFPVSRIGEYVGFGVNWGTKVKLFSSCWATTALFGLRWNLIWRFGSF